MDESNKLRQALKSPIVMMGLCVIAGFAIYANLMKSLPDTSLSTSLDMNQLESPLTHATSKLPFTVDKEKAETWINFPIRDPFAPGQGESVTRQEYSQVNTPGDTKKSVKVKNTQRNGLVLKAVAIEDQYRSAVINRTVVREGEEIEGYQIMSIQPDGVWLKYKGQSQFLTFAEKASS